MNPINNNLLPASQAHRPDRRRVWEWNLNLLAKTAIVLAIVLPAIAGLYVWQSSRLAEGMLNRAVAAEQSGDIKEQARWLTRYVSLVPDDVESQVNLAFAMDSGVDSAADLDPARRTLANALVMCGTSSEYADQKQLLREKLIVRLVQLGPIWANEAEKQIIELKRPAADPVATKWMAQALVSQFASAVYKSRDAKQYNEQSDPWRWLSTQPPGDVLLRAWSLNQNDVDLSSSLIAACLEHPEWFQSTGEPEDAASIEKIAQQVVDRLEPMDDGRAQWTVYVYLANSAPQTAQQKLQSAVEGAFSRLAQHTAANKKAESAVNSKKGGDNSSLQALTAPRLDLVAEKYQPFWDWQIVSELARLNATIEPEQARKLFQRLLENDSPQQTRQQREMAYAAYGSLVAQLESLAAAMAIWKTAAGLLPESLELTRMLVKGAAIEKDFDQARVHLKEFQSIIDLQTARLSGAAGAELTTLVKQSIRLRLDLAQWEALLLQARINFATDEYREAIQYAQRAFDSPVVLTNEQRVEAGKILAECYTQISLWDMVGQTLDRCVTLSPTDLNLRRAAAAAWTNIGAADRASVQLNQIDDGSFNAALEIARLTARAEAAQTADQAELTAVVKAIAEARRRFESAPTEPSAVKNVWQLDLLELKYSDASVSSSGSADSRAADKLNRLQQIAESHPGVSDVQMLAASSMAKAGRYEANQQAIQRLELVAQTTGKSSDAANLAVARANTLAVREGLEPAIVSIRKAMHDLPSEALRLAYAGVELALQSKQTKVAYELLASVPEEQLDTQAIMTLAGIGTSLSNSPPEQIPDLEHKLSQWVDQLKTIEGEEGTHWRYLAAQRLMITADSANNAGETLKEATRLFNEIDARRPRWGLAATLGARIAIAKGVSFTEESIALLQRAISDGDRQIGTIWLLVQQLKRAGRIDEAEKELQRIGRFTESYLPMTAMMVDFAEGRGESDQALTLAQRFVDSNPDNYTSWLFQSQRLLKAGSKVSIAETSKQELLAKAGTSLAKAHELSKGLDIDVWDTRFRLQLANEDNAAAEQILQELEQSAIADEPRLLAAGRGYMQLEEFNKARERFEACIAINPKSSAAYLSLSDLHSRTGDATALLDVLRRGLKAIPNDSELRDRLAINLAYGSDEGSSQAEQRSAELQRLLQDVSSSSSTRSQLRKDMIELDKGTAQQQSVGLLDLRKIAAESSAEGTDAKRILANHFAVKWLQIAELPANSNEINEIERIRRELETPQAKRNFTDAVNFFEQLASTNSPAALDLARHVDFLLKAYVIDKKYRSIELADFNKSSASRVLGQLERITGSSLICLQLRLRLALANGEENNLKSITADWISGAGELDPQQLQNVTELAGRTLSDLGFVEDSLVWLEQVYQKDPAKYQLYAVALARARKPEKAMQICITGYKNDPTAESATLLAEVAMASHTLTTGPEIEELFQEALQNYRSSPDLLEAFATLRLLQERFEEAAVWFQEVEKLDPDRIKTLNNLALALAELPMGKETSVRKIERAIEIIGRMPELLDTLGIVLHRVGRLEEAEKVLEEAAERVNDPRFQLHLAHIALDQSDSKSAQQAYEAAYKAKLDIASLNSKERTVWAQLEKQFSKE